MSDFAVRAFDTPAFDLNGACVMITGGTGSFGRALLRKLLAGTGVRRVVVYSRDEQKHVEMMRSAEFSGRSEIRNFIGDVRDANRLSLAMSDVDYVVHAAAMKHIDLAEYNPFECIRTNVLGAENVVNAALANGVKKVIALSTDKACNPVNLYGASKLASDKIFVSANNLAGSRPTRFAVVRYGNVLGSAGSVVPYFARLLREQTAFLPITEAQMTRFWITLEQGVNFVLSNFALMRGGEIFIPKIPSMRITDLAHAMAPGVPTRIIGIRPGEKLHEAMISPDDARTTVELEDRYVVEPQVNFFTRESIPGARPVAGGFSYTSDNNVEWMGEATLNLHLKTLSGSVVPG